MAMQRAQAVPCAHESTITAVAYDQTRGVVFVGAEHPDIRAWSTREPSATPLAHMRGHKGFVTALVYCEGTSVLISGSVDCHCILWDDRFKALQIIATQSAIRCLFWSGRTSVLGMGQNPAASFYTLPAKAVVSHRRAKQRQKTISGSTALPAPVWLQEPSCNRHVGSYKLARLREADELKAISDPGLARAALLQPHGPALIGPEHGHTDAVTDLVITDRDMAMTAGLDRALCIFSVSKPRETLRKIDRAHAHGIIKVAHDLVNNWFVSGGYDGAVKVWSDDGKPVARFDGGAEAAARVAYIPLTHSYWLVSRFGHLHAYDARVPAEVTHLVQEGNDLAGQDVADLFVLPSCDSVFASTAENGLVQYRYNHYGAYRTFAGHAGWAEAMIVIQAPVEDDLSLQFAELRAQEERTRAAATARPAAPSQRQQMLTARRDREEKEARARREAAAAAAAAEAAATATPCPADTNLAQFAERRRDTAGGNGGVGELVSERIAQERDAQQAHLRRQRTLRQSMAAHGSGRAQAGVRWDDEGAPVAPLEAAEAELADRYLRGGSVHASALTDAMRLEVPGRHALREESSASDREARIQDAKKGAPLGLAGRGGGRSGDAAPDATAEFIFTACAAGVVHRWAIDRQLQSDEYRILTSYTVDEQNILALAHCPDAGVVAAASASGCTRLISLHPEQRMHGAATVSDPLRGHKGAVCALAYLGDFVLVSGGADRDLRFWDLHTLRELDGSRKAQAHQAQITGLAFIASRQELASAAQENVAKVWDVSVPGRARLRFQLEAPGEIAQLVWVPWKERWLTMSADGAFRLWSPEGEMVFRFAYNGGAVQAALVDTEHELVLAAMQDARIRVFDLEDPVPKARYCGHGELVKGIAKVRELSGYATCSWDKTLRVWKGHVKPPEVQEHYARVLRVHDPFVKRTVEATMSDYERQNPRFVPPSLQAPEVPLSLLDAIASRQESSSAKKEPPLFSRAQAMSVKLDNIDQELRTHLASEARQTTVADDALRACEEASAGDTLRHGLSTKQSCHVHMDVATGAEASASLLLSLEHAGAC